MPTLQEDRARMMSHFANGSAATGNKWDELWKKGDFLPFDRHMPNPAFEDLLAQREDLLGSRNIADGRGGTGLKRRKRALVPGCGRGYDVLLLASFGYDAYGLEVSEAAVERCRENEKATASQYPVRDESVGAGKVVFIQGDFFEEDWLDKIDAGGNVDIIYDYTFLSALPPSMRPAWALQMSRLLADEGHLVCIEFPSNKDPLTGGPPYALPPSVYAEHLAHPGEELAYSPSTGHIIEGSSKVKNAAGLRRIAHWQPERTHEIGKGHDWISIWQH